MKKLNNELINKNLFVDAELVYGKEKVVVFGKMIYDISCAVVTYSYFDYEDDFGEEDIE